MRVSVSALCTAGQLYDHVAIYLVMLAVDGCLMISIPLQVAKYFSGNSLLSLFPDFRIHLPLNCGTH